MSGHHIKKPHLPKHKALTWKDTGWIATFSALAIGSYMVNAPHEDPEEAKKLKLNNGCSLSGILSSVTKPTFNMTEDGVLLEIRGKLYTDKALLKNPACAGHFDKANKALELVITFKPLPAPAPSPVQP